MLSLAANTTERQTYLNFTTPYLIFPRVLVTGIKEPFVNNFALLASKRIGMVKGYAMQDFIREHYPNITIVDVENIKNGLEKVAKGELYGFIDGMDTVGYHLQEEFLGQLKVSGKFDKSKELGLGLRNDHPLLLNIFNKMIDNLSQIAIQNITDKSPSIRYIQRPDYSYLWWLLFVVVLIITAFVYKRHLLNNLNKELNEKIFEKTQALQALNESLEMKIKERTETIERSKVILQDVAYKDNLTGIFNRHYLFEKAPLFFVASIHLKEPLSMLIIDIDHFKKVNDVYGHIIGDNIIKHCVGNIQKNLRTDDLFARYGGEEFLVLLPRLTIHESIKVAEKLRLYLEQHHYRLNEISPPIPITISIGISEYQVGEALEKFIDRTDVALYKAKENGRNQVQTICCTDEIPK
ncbi:diguanylate cyclase [Psychromonas sp. KJ10-10]|uniref:transporter substrate-binding domain-containing diguanylate cyclase n=1 Tax=Psychromonas sp. KJ10-10 TaxID=3391823 RepID=UPI0039B3DE7F